MIKKVFLIFLPIIIYAKSGLISFNANDSLTIEKYKELSESYLNTQLDSSLYYIDTALSIARHINHNYLEAECLNRQGIIYKKKGKYEKTLESLFEALKIRKQIGDSAKIGSSFENIGQVYKNMGQKSSKQKDKIKYYKKAFDYYYQSKKIKERINNAEYLAGVYNGLGILHRLHNNFDSTIFYFQKSAIIYTSSNKTLKLAKTFHNIGNLHFSKKNYSKANEYYKKAEKNYTIENSKAGLGQIYLNMGSIYEALNNSNLTKEYYKKSLEKFIQTQNTEYVDYFFKILSEFYEDKKNYKEALIQYKYFIAYKDSILDIEKEKAIAELEISYKTKEKEQELLFEKEKTALLEKQKKNKELMLYILSFLIVLILVIVTFILKNLKQKQKLTIQEITIKKQEINRLLKEQELKSYEAILEGQDIERKRIAKDLHDRLGSTLSTVKLHFQSIEQRIDDLKSDNKKQYKLAYHLLDNAVGEVREIAHNLSSGILQKFGLIAALKDLKNTIEASNKIKTELYIDGLRRKLPPKMEIEIYRVIQELVSNVLKHANASEIILQLNYLEDNLNLTFQDNGIGFNPEKTSEGMGLKNIKARVSKFDGNLHIDSNKKNGTTIIIDLPV